MKRSVSLGFRERRKHRPRQALAGHESPQESRRRHNRRLHGHRDNHRLCPAEAVRVDDPRADAQRQQGDGRPGRSHARRRDRHEYGEPHQQLHGAHEDPHRPRPDHRRALRGQRPREEAGCRSLCQVKPRHQEHQGHEPHHRHRQGQDARRGPADLAGSRR